MRSRFTALIRRLIPFALLLLALGFVAHVVPVRDRCRVPGSPPGASKAVPPSAWVATTRTPEGCKQYPASGEVSIPRDECGALQCEPGIVSTFSGASPTWLILAALLYGVGTLAAAIRWRLVLAFAAVNLPILTAWRIATEAQALGIVLPGGIGGDALKIASVVALPEDGEGPGGRSRGDRITVVIAATFLDRVIGLTAIVTVAAVVGFFSGGQTGTTALVIFALFPIGLTLGVWIFQHPRWQTVAWFNESAIGQRLRPLVQYLGDPRAPGAVFRGFGMSLVVSTTLFICIRLVVSALGGVPTDERWVYEGAAMAIMVAALPLAPGGWGTTDAAYVAFLGNAGLSASVALGVSLSLRLFWYATALVGGLLYVVRKRRGEPSEIVTPEAVSSPKQP